MKFKQIIMLAFLVAGTMIGAGILAMPIMAGITGFWPSVLMLVFFSLSMLFSGIVLANEVNSKKDDSFNFPSLYEEHFGVSGKWLASTGNLIIFYGLLTSYLAGATKIVLNIFKINLAYEPLVLLAIFTIFSILAASTISLIKKYNSALMVLLWTTFFILIFIGSSSIELHRYEHVDWAYLPVAIPMIIAAFIFHTIIPSICKDAKWSSEIYKPIVLGLIMGFAMNTIWLIVTIGVVPEFGDISLNAARLTGIPITVEMSQLLKSELFLIVGASFAIIAITTSYLSIGISLKDFLKDFFENSLNIYNTWIVLAVAFIPALVVSYLFADIFLEALNIVGGIGLVLLFGIMPTIIFYKKHSSKLGRVFAGVLFLAFSATLVITLLQTFGIINFHPHTS